MHAVVMNQEPDGSSATDRRGGVSRQKAKKVNLGVINDPSDDDGREARVAVSGHDDDDQGFDWPCRSLRPSRAAERAPYCSEPLDGQCGVPTWTLQGSRAEGGHRGETWVLLSGQ